MMDEYELNAYYYANVGRVQHNAIACVHLENDNDETFWKSILQSQRPGVYYFITYCKDKTTPSNSSQCLKYKPYLSKRFFIGIDSDMRYLLQKPGLDAAHFVCQTYTYSWENHFCEAQALQSRFLAQCPERANKFDFVEFLTAYSNAVFKPMLLLLYCLKNHDYNFTRNKFDKCLPHQCKGKELAKNGALIVERISKNFEPYLNSPFAKSVDIEAESVYCEQLGITEENAYLHVRGHNLIDLVCYIGEMKCRGADVSFKNDILLKNLPPYNYWQIEKVATDINQIVHV